MLSFDEVHVGYGRGVVLHGVSLAVPVDGVAAVLGHNGAGKSTLLRVMARIYRPSTGTLDVRGMVAPLIEMGAGFNPELSGLENIILNGAMFGYGRKAMLEKVEGIWDFTELREFANLPLKYYSSGMYLRLAFGVATGIDPDILLVDEALGVGDAAFAEKAKARIRGLIDRSNLVVIVSHNMTTLRELCTRGVRLDHGRVVADGPIDEVIDAYLAETGASRVA